jgi:hypothetical protein
MILTEKGSTRATVSILLLAALIFLGSRFAVNFIEATFPQPAAPKIDWKPVKDILKDDENLLEHMSAESEETIVSKTGKVDAKSVGRAPEEAKKRFALNQLFPDNIDHRPILFFFADDSSVLTKRMEERTFSIPAIRDKIEKQFYPVKIRFDKPLTKTEYKLFKNYGAAAAPLLAVRSATGESLAYNTGYLSAVKTIVLLENALRTRKKLEENAGLEP